MAHDPDTLVDALKAAGEPTRLRILALLRRGDLAVGELVQILDQSQPRLSHHLKTLTNAMVPLIADNVDKPDRHVGFYAVDAMFDEVSQE